MLTIIRGMPGAGKSTAARALAAEYHSLFLEPDMFMYQDGQYRYTPDSFKSAVAACQLMLFRFFMQHQNARAIYADVLPKVSDVTLMVGTAKPRQWEVIDMPPLTIAESMRRNTHAVRKRDLEKFYNTWEPWTREAEIYLKGFMNEMA